MRIDRVVLNASPLICLSKGGLLRLLDGLFSEVAVPDKVYHEVSAKSGVDLSALKRLRSVSDITVPPSVVSWDLGEGESSVLAFALKNSDYWAVIDDREARRCAASIGRRYTGTVGIVLLAKKRGVIRSVRESLLGLQKAGLWLSEPFVEEACRRAGE